MITINSTDQTIVNFAWFAKPKGPATLTAGVNGLVESLEISRIDLDSYKDITVEWSNLRKIGKMVSNPRIKAVMVMPVKVFVDFKFDKFVYLKSKDLTGYFFVEKIDGYKDGKNNVRVDLLYV